MANRDGIGCYCNDCGGRLREGIARAADKTKQGRGEYKGQASAKNPLPDSY